MLIAEQLSKIYRDPAGDVTALSGFDHAFEAGALTAIMGPSGSGKSTLLNVLAGLDVPTTGSVWLDGTDISRLPEAERALLRLNRFGFVFQSVNLISVLTAVQNVAFPMGLAGFSGAERSRRAQLLLTRFGLEARAHHLPHKLSGGEKQRVALARALANDPDVIFADEPTGNLDSKSGRVVTEILQGVAREGRTVIVVTHDAAMADGADVILELADGMLKPEPRLRLEGVL